jgi:apolipoprotein D and lipocalin family protein
MRGILICLAACAIGGPGLAGAPQPARPAPAALYSGRWYDIAHTPNSRQKDCQGPSSEFTGWDGGAVAIAQTCHTGSPRGPAAVFRAAAKIIPGSGAAKFRAFFLGGLLSQEYWILDHGPDETWAILATPGGHYVWLMSRAPVMDGAARAAAVRRIAALGYDAAHLAFSIQQPR